MLQLTLFSLLFTLIHALDGNFKAYIKAKRFDANDTPITDGSGFFPPWSTWHEFCSRFNGTSSVSPLVSRISKAHAYSQQCSQDGGTCPSYNTMHTITAHRGRFISGVASLMCARHGTFVPQGTVDLDKGETYVYRASELATT